MHPFPHIYRVSAAAGARGSVSIAAAGVPPIDSAPPVEFGGPGDKWSPESLLCAAVADCFILTFRALARAAKLDWLKIECRVEGKLERVEGKSQFTNFVTYADLTVAVGADSERATRVLEKSEHDCLIANSLNGGRSLETRVIEVNPSVIEVATA